MFSKSGETAMSRRDLAIMSLYVLVMVVCVALLYPDTMAFIIGIMGLMSGIMLYSKLSQSQ